MIPVRKISIGQRGTPIINHNTEIRINSIRSRKNPRAMIKLEIWQIHKMWAVFPWRANSK